MTQAQKTRASGTAKAVWLSLVGVGFTVVVVLLLLWLAGVFHRKIAAGSGSAAAAGGQPVGPDVTLVPARVRRVPTVESAVGTIRAVHESAIAAKLLARVVEVNVQAGQEVHAGQVLVRLDDADLRAQRRQAEAGVAAAQAARNQAQIEYDRVRDLFERAHASKTEFDQAETALKTATAEQQRAEQALAQAEAVLDYATIRSPMDGKVVDKLVEVGDTARPGQILLTLYDPTRMQLVANVRESLTQRLAVGQMIGVRIDAIAKTCAGQISEIVPQAEAASRTFAVKVTGPCPPGVYSGMFGRLLIPLDEQDVLVIPRAAVRRIGQLDTIDVAEPSPQGPVLRRRVVQLGKPYDDEVEVLSGLRADEQVAVGRPGA
ncbi:MAG: efflux RND transporter periplasmic adaptor subunit [Planctomycetota bacterium]